MNKYSVVSKLPMPRANPTAGSYFITPSRKRKRRSRAQIAATRKLVKFNRRRSISGRRRATERVTSFRHLPVRLLEKRGGAWRTVAAFQGTPRGIKRAKSYARKYASFERVQVKLIRA